jgi:3-hydroxyisobutyrate dehydrogenase
MANLGFVGLGTMGGRIVLRLLKAGHTVYGYNRTQARCQPQIDAGMQWRNTPREVAEAADITMTMVSDTAALAAVADGPDGVLAGLSAGKIFVDMGLESPTFIRDLAQRTAERGAQMLDAPVSGSIGAVEAGTLVIYVGGSAGVLEQVRPIFEQFSQKVIHIGENGQAAALKVAINLNLGAQLISLYEGVLLAERSGIARETALDAILNSVAASPAMKYRAPFILNMPEEAWYSIRMFQKDTQIALEMGRELGVPLLNTSVSHQFLSSARSLGYGEEDFAALFFALEHMAGGSNP